MNTMNERAPGSSSSSESLSEVTDESSTSSYEDEVISQKKGTNMMKKVKKLRSMKLAKLPSLKLITRLMRIQPDYSSLYPSDAASSEQSIPPKMLQFSPNYMKTTNSSDARKETAQKSSRTLIRRSGFKPGKSLTRLSSTRYTNSITRRGSGETIPKKKVKKSRSTMLLNQHSTVSSNVADIPKILQPTNARNPQASPDSLRVMTRTTTLRPVRVLTKVASLRIRRPSKKRSPEIPDPSVHRATCASALKESKFPDNLELHREKSESEGIQAMKVCPYSYCSLHGHHRRSSDLPPLKRFVSIKRRHLKSQKSTQSESRSRRGKRSGNTKKQNQPTQTTDTGDALILGTAHESDSVSIREPTAEQSPHCEETNKYLSGDNELNTDDTGPEFSVETSVMEEKKYVGLWGLIYKHMASGIEAAEEDSLRTCDEIVMNEVEESNISDQSTIIEDYERCNMNSQLHQYNAIKLVQEAFDKILSEIPDQSSDDKLKDDKSSVYKDVSEDDRNEDDKLSTSISPDSGGEKAAQDEERTLHPVSEIDPSEGGKAEPITERKTRQQAPKSWSNLKKVIILRRFVKSMEKVRNLIPRKPQYLPISHGPEAEKVNLCRQEMLGRKASEEWMLDYALQNVISKLDPAQRRKVALLVQAFESVAPLPEMSNPSSHVEASPRATTAQNSADWQDRKENESKKQTNFGVLSKACFPKSADYQIPSSKELSDSREVTKVDVKPDLEDHECGLNSHNKEPRKVISPCREHSEKMSSQAISNADAHSSASDSALQGISSEATVGETKVKNIILKRFSNLLEESKSVKTTGAELEKQLQKQKNMRLWLMIYKHMASGTTTALGKDYTKNDSNAMDGMPEAPSQDANTVNDDPVDQKIKLQQIEAIRLVEEAIDGIELPENQEDSPEDQSASSDNTPDTHHLEREFVQDEEPVISSPAGSIKAEDRTTLDMEEPSLASSNLIYEGNAEGLKKIGSETKSAMKNWSNLKKMILIRRFVKSLENVNKFTLRGPRFFPHDSDKEAEKVNLRHQDVDDRKNADEWMLDYALQQVVAKLTPARKRKVALLVEAFETVVPTIKN